MVLSKALKAKLSSCPSWSRQSVDARPKRKNRRAFVQPPTVAMIPLRQGLLEALLDDCAMVRAKLWVLSLSVEEGRSTFGGVAGILAKF